ncbi:unnamed protein product [Closterium sp. Yama58-4]|nr:unnamed protein product [Closterium sp. Yama58-4]
MTGRTVGYCIRRTNMNVTLLLVLLACVFAIQAAPLRGRRGMTGEEQHEQEYIEMPQDDDNAARANELPSFERSMELYRAWERVYGLADPAQPPARIALPPNVPRAPHLEDCSARSAFRRQTEARGARGEAPAWTSAPSECRYPQPPWVRGSDAANLAATRQAQADIWLHQFPAPSPSASAQAARGACGGRRLLVVPWPSRRNGIGSQIHIMSAWLNHALSHDRILVPTPGSFERANHSHCTGADKGSFSCYFFPVVSPACDEAALEAIAAVAAAAPAEKGGVREVVMGGGVSVLATSPTGMGAEEMAAVMASDARVLLFTESTFPPHSTALAASVLATSPTGMGAEDMAAVLASDARILLFTESTFPPHATALAAREKGSRGGDGWAVLTVLPAPVPNPSFPSPSPSHQAVGHGVSEEHGGNRGDVKAHSLLSHLRPSNPSPPPISLTPGGGEQHTWRAGGPRSIPGEQEGHGGDREGHSILSPLLPPLLTSSPHSHLPHTRWWGTAYLESRGDTEVMGRVTLFSHLSSHPFLPPPFTPISLTPDGGEQHIWRAMGTRRRWGTAYLESRGDTEVMGRVRAENPPYLQVHWWRAQSFRFMLRWPSAYLCHLTNRARHEAYGLPVATRLVNSLLQQQNIIASLSSTSSSASPSLQDSANPDNLKINASSEAAVLAALSFSPQTSLETRAWPALGFDGCSSETHVSPEIARQLDLTPSSSASSSLPLTFTPQGIVDSVYEGVGGEVYMPRPVVSVHVRQGDKAIEMELSSFASYMFLAHRLRSHTPDLQYAWLSTEMEGDKAIELELSSFASYIRWSSSLELAYKDWTFFYTRNKRQTGATAMVAYEQDAGVELLVGVSFANLIIASECDYFIGPLKSNWNRLINGLRMTNGRMNRGYAALNFGGW